MVVMWNNPVMLAKFLKLVLRGPHDDGARRQVLKTWTRGAGAAPFLYHSASGRGFRNLPLRPLSSGDRPTPAAPRSMRCRKPRPFPDAALLSLPCIGA